MGTRGCIAYLSGQDIRGVYHNYDSYPSGLGAALFNFRNNVFGNTDIMLNELIDKAPNGWNSISKTITNYNVIQKVFNPDGKLTNSTHPSPIHLADLASHEIDYCYIFFDSIMTIIGRSGRIDSSPKYYDEFYTGYMNLGSVYLDGEEPACWRCNENGLYLFDQAKINLNSKEEMEEDEIDEGPTGHEFDEPSIPLHLQGIDL
jgi:hypothetical protein